MAHYQSDESEHDEQEGQVRKKRENRTWVHKETFETAAEAFEWVKNQKKWTSITEYDTDSGRKKVYRCNSVAKRGPQCAAGI